MSSKAKAAVLIAAIIAAFLTMSYGPSAVGATASAVPAASGWQIPQCKEDEVISKRGRCLTHDSRTTRYQVVSEAGWGYWVDTRYPRSRHMRPLVPACYRWQMVTRAGGCVGRLAGDFRGGWWYQS